MKTCEYCGGEVPDSTETCPNCAAHVEDLPTPWIPPADYAAYAPPPDRFGVPKESLERTFSHIGKLVVVFLGMSLLAMFLGLTQESPVLLLALVLLLGAGYILKKAL